MNLIVSADRNWSIGKNGRPLVNIPAERQILLKETAGKTVVMGRKTLETLPGGQPLKGRTNIILSSDPSFKVRGAVVCTSLEEALEYLREFDSEDIYILGGESIYRQFLPFCDTIHLTSIDYVYDADLRFPEDLNQSPDWELAEEGEEQTYFDLCYTFCRYVRKTVVTSGRK